MTNGTVETIDMHALLTILEELRDKAIELDGSRVNIEVRSKEVSALKAEINRKLLYLAHLANLAEVELMSQYHRFKGENPPFLSVD